MNKQIIKNSVCIVTAVATFACVGNPKKTAQTADADTVQVETIASPLREGEALEVGTIYRDTVTYLEFDDRGDYNQVLIKKGDYQLCALTSSDGWEINRGDIVQVEWKMDSMWVAGDDERLYTCEWVTRMERIKKGPLTCWKRDYPRPIEYNYPEEFGDDYAQRCHEAAEWYFCHLTTKINKPLWEIMNHRKGVLKVSFAPWMRDIEQCGNEETAGQEEEGGWPAVIATVEESDSDSEIPNICICTFGITFDCRDFVYWRYSEDKNDFTIAQYL